MDDLDYEKHLEFYKGLFGYFEDKPETMREETLKAAEEGAKHHHAICVFDPLRDLVYAIASASNQLRNKNSKYFMLYGAARRSNLLFGAYREIRSIAYEKRTQPLSQIEQMTLSQAINSTYIHLLGIFDNFAWSILYERHPDLENKLYRNDVSLFSKEFRKQCTAFSEIAEEVVSHDEWHKDVKERRNPVAHRIPLYVPPTVLTPDQVEQYFSIEDESDSSGYFHPCFIHHPDEPYIPIYPTIPTDLSHLIRIWRPVSKLLATQ